MNRNTTIGLVLALGVAVVGLWWATSTSKPPTGLEEAAGPKRLIDPPLGEIREFEVASPGSVAPLKFTIETGKATMTSPVPGPADYNAVTMSTTMYKEMRYSRAFPAGDAERPTEPMSGLASPIRTVTLKDGEGRSAIIKIGARQALSAKTYVQKQGDETIYLVDTDVSAELRKGLADYRGKRLTEFTQSDAVRIEIQGDPTYTLVREGEHWNIDAPYKARADRVVVNRILAAASNLHASKFVDDEAKNLRPYGLENPRTVVTIVTEKKTPRPQPTTAPASAPAEPQFDVETRTFKLALGGVADDMVFARLLEPALPSVFDVAQSSVKDLQLPLDELRDRTVVSLAGRNPQKIVYTSGQATVTLVKNAAAQWELEPATPVEPARPAEYAAVEDLLRNLRELKAVGFETTPTPVMGFDAPRARIELTLEGQVEPVRLAIGQYTPSKTGAYARNEQGMAIAVIPAKVADELAAGPLSFWSRDLVRFTRDHVVEVEITRDGKTLKLAKQEGTWKFLTPIQGDCEQGMLNAVLADLANLRGRRVIGLAADAKKLGLDKPAVRAVVSTQAPAPPPSTQTSQPVEPPAQPIERHVVLIARELDGERVFAMAEGGDRICEIDARVIQNLEAEFFSTRIVSFEPSDVTQLRSDGSANFLFEKVGENWRLRGEETFAVDVAKINQFCGTLRDLRAARFVAYDGARPADYGLDAPQQSFTIQTIAGDSFTLNLSARGPDSQSRYASLASAPGRIFVIKSEDVPKLAVGLLHFQQAG